LVFKFIYKKIVNKSKLITTFLALFYSLFSISQIKDGYNEFFYSSGTISSKGLIKNGKPEGYWVTFYENGKLKSEGNRNNHQLDSVWKFYNSDGFITSLVEYQSGKKNGYRLNFNKDSIITKEEFFNNDTIELIREFYENGKIKLKLPFENGLKNGLYFEYDTLGIEKTWCKYKKGKAQKISINRFNSQGKRSGKWIEFDNEIIRTETNYFNGLKNGIEKIFDKKGNLKKILKYSNGIIIKDVKELVLIEIKNEFSTDGNISKSGSYNENGKPHGIHRVFDENGNVKSSNVFNNGVLTASGVVKKTGKKDGLWVLYYESGEILGKGLYENGCKFGHWIYYYENGLVESEGNYNAYGKEDGIWKEYSNTGSIREEVNFLDGFYNGLFTAYNDTGKIIKQGNYSDDYETGEWFYINGSYSEFGSYIDGMKTGEWRHFYLYNQIVFKGIFALGLPIGEHIFWHENGNLKRIGTYINSRKEGEWLHYTKEGRLLLIINYENGLEKRYNGYNINPEHELDDYIEYENTGYRWMD